MSDHHRALAHLRRRDWQKAHALVMDLDDKVAFHIHGLVHRLEGDMENARYSELKKIESELETAS